MRQSSRSGWACFVIACSIAVASAGDAVAGQSGGHDGGGQHGDHDAGAKSGDNGAGSKSGEHDAGAKKGDNDAGAKNADNEAGDTSSSIRDDDGDPDFSSNSQPVDDSAVGTADPAASVDPSVGGRQSLDLPPTLRPLDENDRSSRPFEARPGVPAEVVRTCRNAIASAAAPFGSTRVRARSAGFVHRLSPGLVTAPLVVSIDYLRQGGVETRQARINCRLSATGDVIGLT